MHIVAVAEGVLASVGGLEEACASWNPTREDSRVAASKTSSRAQAYVGARCLLRNLLAHTVGSDAAHARIVTDVAGKPALSTYPRIGISMSTSHGRCAVALGIDRAVGIDVEAVRPVGPHMLRRCCTPAGLRFLDSLDAGDRAREFTWLWTAQEACVKATGTGLAGRPWQVPVEPGFMTGTWDGIRWRALRDLVRMPTTCAYSSAITSSGR